MHVVSRACNNVCILAFKISNFCRWMNVPPENVSGCGVDVQQTPIPELQAFRVDINRFDCDRLCAPADIVLFCPYFESTSVPDPLVFKPIEPITDMMYSVIEGGRLAGTEHFFYSKRRIDYKMNHIDVQSYRIDCFGTKGDKE